MKKLALVCFLALIAPGCILLSDISEGFNAVPYDGMYTTAYGANRYEKDGELYLDMYKEQFPIGFFGSMNVKFWNAYGDYRNTCTYRRYQEWRKLPDSEKQEIYGRKKNVDGKWVDVPLD